MFVRILSFATIASLAACGGGGGGSSSAAATTPVASTPAPVSTTMPTNPAPAAPVAPENTPVADPTPLPAVTAAALVADADFKMVSHRELAIDVDITDLGNNQGYLSVCAVDENDQPKYDDCYVQVALGNETFSTVLSLSTAITKVASAIWFLDLSLDPIVQAHDISTGRLIVSN